MANAAYLAACNGQRVLVMDWDLEAPGLLYYFRGLSNPEQMESAKHSEGVLNLLWSWHALASNVESIDDMEFLVNRFASGNPFGSCVHSIAEQQTIAGSGELYYMSAGSLFIETKGGSVIPYAQALSQFPWSEFYTESAGAAFIDIWRKWAKENFDLVLIDSRTGLADVAGLCTMQMPDEVALCLVLNRQNIDGTGRVAASIREGRGGEIALRALPMRVARADTSEETDARARAISVLVKSGGFSSDEVSRDFAQLSVAASENVPFYETLAPFSTQEPSLDPLSLNYCRMASSLLNVEISPPSVEDSIRQQVRRRQAHDRRSATVDYVKKLTGVDPARAVDELGRLVDSAWAAVHDDEALSVGYIQALSEAATLIDFSEFEGESWVIRDGVLQLLRHLHSENSEQWRDVYVLLLDRLLNSDGILLDPALSELGLLDEIEFALASDWSVSGVIRRMDYRRRAAWAVWTQTDNIGLAQSIALEVKSVLENAATTNLSDEQQSEVSGAIAEMDVLLGDIEFKHGQPNEALGHYLNAARSTTPKDGDWSGISIEARRVSSAANAHIATRFSPELVAPEVAANHALRAADAQPSILYSAQKFFEFTRIFSHPDAPRSSVHVFSRNYFNQPLDKQGRGPYAGTIGTRPTHLVGILENFSLLLERLPSSHLPAAAGCIARIMDSARIRATAPSQEMVAALHLLISLTDKISTRLEPEDVSAIAMRDLLSDRARQLSHRLHPEEGE